MYEHPEVNAGSHDPDDIDALLVPLRHDAVLGAIVGAWVQDERRRRAAGLLLRVHRASPFSVTAPGEVRRILPPFFGHVLDAHARGDLVDGPLGLVVRGEA